MKKKRVINYVADNRGWVHFARADEIGKRMKDYKIRTLTRDEFKLLWMLGFLRGKPIYFSTWRIVHSIEREGGGVRELLRLIWVVGKQNIQALLKI